MSLTRVCSPKFFLYVLAIVGIIWFSPQQLFPQTAPQTPPPTTLTTPSARVTTSQQTQQAKTPAEKELLIPYTKRPSLITQAALLSLFALLPFIIMILTSFLKMVVVLSLLRSALGVQQSPPNQIINGVAFMLSLFVMYPTGLKMYDAALNVVNHVKAPDSLISPESSSYIIAIADEAKEPLRDFIKRNSSVKHQALFYRIAYRVLPDQYRPGLKPDDFMILVPAFITSQLKEAFEIGVLIYIPFFVIDRVTSNVLLAMGMMMLSPVTISMPLKLFLLVMLDGWTLLIEGLINTYRL
jgi:type III secretion protein R